MPLSLTGCNALFVTRKVSIISHLLCLHLPLSQPNLREPRKLGWKHPRMSLALNFYLCWDTGDLGSVLGYQGTLGKAHPYSVLPCWAGSACVDWGGGVWTVSNTRGPQSQLKLVKTPENKHTLVQLPSVSLFSVLSPLKSMAELQSSSIVLDVLNKKSCSDVYVFRCEVWPSRGGNGGQEEWSLQSCKPFFSLLRPISHVICRPN